MAIRAVLFDHGGVLSLNGQKGSIEAIITQLYGKEIGWDRIEDLHDDLRKGLISTESFFQALAERHKSSQVFSEKDWRGIAGGILERSAPVYDLVEALKTHNIKTAILSNIYEMTADTLRKAGDYDGFDPVILSYQVKLAKPDIRIFQLAIESLGVEPSEIIYVDDQEKNIPPAQSLGMSAILVSGANQIVSDIKYIIKTENNIEL